MSFLRKILGKSAPGGGGRKTDDVIIVSGLPRSGTSMMMKMLVAGGLEPVIDNIRTADTDNPEGYFEFERVKALDKGDKSWVAEARGKVVKVISALLQHLPPEHHYKVIFMERRLHENLASQKKMLINRGEDTSKITDEELLVLLQKHLSQVYNWLNRQPNIELLIIRYHEMVENTPNEAKKVNDFVGGFLDVEKMSSVADRKLYRNR